MLIESSIHLEEVNHVREPQQTARWDTDILVKGPHWLLVRQLSVIVQPQVAFLLPSLN